MKVYSYSKSCQWNVPTDNSLKTEYLKYVISTYQWNIFVCPLFCVCVCPWSNSRSNLGNISLYSPQSKKLFLENIIRNRNETETHYCWHIETSRKILPGRFLIWYIDMYECYHLVFLLLDPAERTASSCMAGGEPNDNENLSNVQKI